MVGNVSKKIITLCLILMTFALTFIGCLSWHPTSNKVVNGNDKGNYEVLPRKHRLNKTN